VRRNIPTIIIEERMLLREGIAALLHGTCYKVIANVASVSEIPYLKLSPGRPLLIILGLLRGRDETLRAVQDVRQAVKVVKLVAVGESLRDDFREINDDGIDAIVFNVGSSDALLKVLDLVLIGQQIVILAPPLESEPVNHTVGHAPTGTIARSGAATESGTKRVGEMLVSSLNSQLSERQQQVLICVARGESTSRRKIEQLGPLARIGVFSEKCKAGRN